MLKILGRANSINVMKALWVADEIGLAYDRTNVGGEFGGNQEAWYRALNPNGVIPTIDDDGYILWESNSIVRYLAAKHAAGTLWPSDPRARGEADRWMDWQLTTIQDGMRVLFWGWIRTAPEKRDLAVLEAARPATAALWQRLDAHLSTRAYSGGDNFTMGDIPVGCMCHRWLTLPFRRDDLPAMPYLEAWYERLLQRPAYRKNVAVKLT
ncbi:MAG: glutathione S-transferase [Acetobacteraceae bacterium]|nr:glutathione S-transferase [Acetobacteraceae bacterium]